MNVQLRLVQPGGQSRIVEGVGTCVRLGRDVECEIALDPVAFAMVSGIHVRIEHESDGFVLTHLSQSNKTLVNDLVVKDSAPINEPGLPRSMSGTNLPFRWEANPVGHRRHRVGPLVPAGCGAYSHNRRPLPVARATRAGMADHAPVT